MDSENIEPGDTLYLNHHVAEPKEVDAGDSSEPGVDFAERSAQVTVDEINEDEETVIVSESTSEETRQWIVKLGHLLRGGVPDTNGD